MKPGEAPAQAAASPAWLVERAAIAPDPHQPRRTGIDQNLEKLTASIRTHGVIEPILVRPHPDPAARAGTPYMIVVGERRWTAAGRVGLARVPAVLLDRELSAAELLMLQIEENEGENRQELALWDLCTAVARALEITGVSQAEFARRHGKSTAWVSHLLGLARATGPLGEALRENLLRGVLVARTFQRLSLRHQKELMARARRDGAPISLGAAEKLAGQAERLPRWRQPVDSRLPAAEGSPVDDEVSSAQDRADRGGRSTTTGGALPAAAVPVAVSQDRPSDRAATRTPAWPARPARPAAPAAPSVRAAAPTADAGRASLVPAAPAAPAAPALREPAAAQPRPPGSGVSPFPGRDVGSPPAAPRSAAASLLAMAGPLAGREVSSELAAARPEADSGDTITVTLSVAKVQKILRLIGLEPASTPQALTQQLLNAVL